MEFEGIRSKEESFASVLVTTAAGTGAAAAVAWPGDEPDTAEPDTADAVGSVGVEGKGRLDGETEVVEDVFTVVAGAEVQAGGLA